MRILAIRGENLASLGQPFNIDFEAEPLAGTGLFAITGETGSGKSTILDALCLALYGAYPRFTQSQQDALPDPSGSRASISDGGTILRRGAGGGYAEVEFIGQDTQRYRARWEARRARKKPDRVIQSALRTLHVVQGSTLTPIASTKTEVQRAVETQTGLTFDQFCRTVLLPQGDFDAFLLAQKTDRGALLEKITGTEIYGRISKIVYEGTHKLKSAAEQLEIRLTNLGLLPSVERESIGQTILALQQDVASKTSEQHALRDRIAHLDNLAQAQDRLAAAELAVFGLRNEVEFTSPDRIHLADLEAAEPLRPLRDRLATALRGQAPAEQNDLAAKSALQEALLDSSNSKTIFDSARAAHDNAEQGFRDFAPLWDEASRLDTERSNALTEATAARTAADAVVAALSTADTKLAKLDEQIKSTELARESAALALEERSHVLPLADQFGNVEALFERYKSGSAEAVKLHKQQTDAAQKAAGLLKTLGACDSQVETATRALQQVTNTALTLQQELEGCEEDKWQTEESDLSTLHRQARDARLLAERYQSATSLLHRAHAEQQAAVTAITDANARTQSSETSLIEQTNRRAETQRSAELAEESSDQRNAQLRSLLVEGENCPICGATNHPYAAAGIADSLTRLAESLRAQRSGLDKVIAVSNRKLQEAASDRATAEGQALSADRNVTQATKEMQNAADEFHELRAVIEPTSTRLGFIEGPPRTLTEDNHAVSLLSQFLAGIQERRAVASEQVAAFKNLRRRLDDAIKSNRDAQVVLNAATQLRDGESASLHGAELEAVTASQLANQADTRLTEIEQALSPFLAAANIPLELLQKNASAVLSTLRKLVDEVAALRTRASELTSRADLLAEAHKEQGASRRNLKDRALETGKSLERREEIFRQVSEARALLLAGEPTAQHRSGMNVARLNALKSLQNAQANETVIAGNLAKVTEQKLSAANTLAKLVTELTQARNAYNDGCSSLRIEPTVADKLLATPPGEITALKARLEALDYAVRDAESTLTERHSLLQSLLAGGGDTTERAQLVTSLENITTGLNLFLQNIGDQRGRLRHDDALRLTANNLRRQSDETASELAIWQQVEDAIGSANGDRFRTFAQSLTLEHLVQLANEHLDSFSRRYQLARSLEADLSLHVIDNDMGEEHRAIRSLSGGERFLVSLSLALSLSGLEGREFSVDTLFIDEGFGVLDADTLDIAITALESLHSRGRKVGVITHVAAMIESIPVQVRVEKLGGGSSVVRLQSGTSNV